MVMDRLERIKLARQRRIRRIRQQNLRHGNGYALNSNTLPHTDDSTLKPTGHPISKLGWSREDALAAHYVFRTFAQDWNAPGMELYDEL